MTVRGSWGYSSGKAERIPHLKVIPEADANEAMRQVLDAMIEHSGEIICGCELCDDYLLVREILLKRLL